MVGWYGGRVQWVVGVGEQREVSQSFLLKKKERERAKRKVVYIFNSCFSETRI